MHHVRRVPVRRVHRRGRVKIRIEPNVAYTLNSTMLPTKCSFCPARTERILDNTLCGSENIDGNIPRKNECCEPCEINYFNTGNDGPCVPVEDRGSTTFPYGNIEAVQCGKGEEMKYDLCQSSIHEPSNEKDWRTCFQCTGVEKPEYSSGRWTCQMCNGHSFFIEDIVVEGEYFNSGRVSQDAKNATSARCVHPGHHLEAHELD